MRERLSASMGPIELSFIRPHLVRDAVIVVEEALDLLDVGEAIARDDKAQVAAWIEQGLIGKPTLERLAAWEKMKGAAWTSVVVQPYVLVREGGSGPVRS